MAKKETEGEDDEEEEYRGIDKGVIQGEKHTGREKMTER